MMNMTKKIIIAFIVCFSVFLSFLFFHVDKQRQSDGSYRIETFNSDDGWGYRVNRNGKTIIYQSYVPCIKGNKPFRNEMSARCAGELVLNKIKNSESPAITMDELGQVINLNDYVK